MKKFDSTKHKDPAKINPRGSLKKNSDNEQYDQDDGSPVTEAGSADMQDEQFDSHLQDSPQSGKLGSKSSGGTPMSFNSGKPHAAASIMREIARASMKQPEPSSNYEPSDKKVSSPKSKSQSKSFDASSDENPQARSKSQVSQKIPKK